MTEELNYAEQNARGWMESIQEFADALAVDWDRLEELKAEREVLQDVVFDAIEAVDQAHAEYTEYVEYHGPGCLKDFRKNLENTCESLRNKEDDLFTWLDREELQDLIEAAGEFEDNDEVQQQVQESALSVQVRSGWHNPGDEDANAPEEFEILLTTGGPALRIIGELDSYCQPMNPEMQWQDWGTPWTEFRAVDSAAMTEFCKVFWFGE